jgi:hypothetical protein
MKKRNRKIQDYISILTYIWIKWINNHEVSNNVNFSDKIRRKSGERCEKLQRIRQKIIILLNLEFEKKIIKKNVQ